MSDTLIDQPPQTIILSTQKLDALKIVIEKSIRIVINFRLARIIKQEHVRIVKLLNECGFVVLVSVQTKNVKLRLPINTRNSATT